MGCGPSQDQTSDELTPKPESIALMQDAVGTVHFRGYACNSGTTCCGLVLAFNNANNVVACYHWPGLTATSKKYQQKFLDNLKTMHAPVSQVLIITNDHVTAHDLEVYIANACEIQKIAKVETHYFVVNEVYTGDIMVQISERGKVRLIDPKQSLREIQLP